MRRRSSSRSISLGAAASLTCRSTRRRRPNFAPKIHAQLDTIGYGEISSYGELAAAVGRPAATRAVGTACGANPLPIIRPFHRVLRSDGTLGGYAGGLDIKRFLLTLEEN